MVPTIRDAGHRVDKVLHDAVADLAWRLGVPLRTKRASDLARSSVVLSDGGSTHWRNPLETDFYGGAASPETVTHPEISMMELANVFVTGSEALIFSDFCTRIITDESQSDVLPRKARRPVKWLSRREKGPLFPLGGRGTGNRGHFLSEHLPRLLLARKSNRCPDSMSLLLTPDHERWQSEYLLLLGGPSQRLLPGSKGSILCESLVTVPNLSTSAAANLYKREVYADIRQMFFAGCPRTSHVRRRILISRSDASSRRLVNESEVFAACREFWPNLESVTLSGMSLHQQVALMRETEVVIGPHGQSFHLNLFLSDALSIQLVPGERAQTNEYLPWATNYERLGLVGGNSCISFFAGPNVTSEDWSFPVGDLRKCFDRLKPLVGSLR